MRCDGTACMTDCVWLCDLDMLGVKRTAVKDDKRRENKVGSSIGLPVPFMTKLCMSSRLGWRCYQGLERSKMKLSV